MDDWKTYNEMTKSEQLLFRLRWRYNCFTRYNKQKKAIEYLVETWKKLE